MAFGAPVILISTSHSTLASRLEKEGCHLRSKYRRMLVHTQRPQRILRRPYRMQWLILPDIPKLDLAVSATTNKFPKTTPLQMYVRDPLFVVAPDFDHCHCGAQALVEDTDGAVAVAAHENIAGDLVRSQRGNAGAGAGGDILNYLALYDRRWWMVDIRWYISQ